MDLLDRLLGHDAWTTRQILLCCREVSEADLHRRFDIGHGTVHETLAHMIGNVRIWADLMNGAVDTSVWERVENASLDELIELHDAAYADFAALARRIRDEDRCDERWTDTLDDPPAEKSFGGAIGHVITHNMFHRADLLHMLKRLGVPHLLEGDLLSWEDAVMSRAIEVRPMTEADLPIVGEMLWEAAAVSDEVRALGMERALALPTVRKYLEGWGRPGDAGVVAFDESGSLGAAWYRLFPAEAPGYGFIAADVPELSIGVSERARGRGAGGLLLDALLETAREQGYRALSLSVDRQNPAVRLYERKGFRDAGVSGPEETSVTMVATFD
jgi:uncharacterized damage-inducible protein DinB/ribosomal protein S18 acetylase RimI-like enzyme